jgi:hypothetical protein
MDIVSQTFINREEPFKCFPCHWSKDEYTYRYIYNNRHEISIVKTKDGNGVYGEDPRPFVLDGLKFFVSCSLVHPEHVTCLKNMNINITNYETGSMFTYNMNEDIYMGKNWTPFVKDNKLFFIHSFDPFTLITDGKVVYSKPLGLDVTKYDSYTSFRGGSNGLQYRDLVFGFGHYTIKNDNHSAFMWILESNTLKLAHLKNDFLQIVNPTSLWIEDGELYTSFYETTHGWFHMDIQCRHTVYRIDFDKLVSDLEWDIFLV